MIPGLAMDWLQGSAVVVIAALLTYERIIVPALQNRKAKKNGETNENNGGTYKRKPVCCEVLTPELKGIADTMIKVSENLDKTAQSLNSLHADMLLQKDNQKEITQMMGRLLDLTNQLYGKLNN